VSGDPTVPPGIVDSITASTSNLPPVLLTVGALGIAVSAGLLAMRYGWRFFQRMLVGGDGGMGEDWMDSAGFHDDDFLGIDEDGWNGRA
jgi:hypothetical protein